MNDSIIILTTTVNIFNVRKIYQISRDERVETYISSILKWLKTDFKIIVVDNSGYTFPEIENSDNLCKISYTYNNVSIPEKHAFIANSGEKGHHEMFAIYHAYNNIPTSWNYKNIFKLTGRYYIPDFKTHIEKIPDSYHYYIQSNESMCELYGGHKDYVHNLIILPFISQKHKILETLKKNRLEELVNNSKNKNIVYKFPKLIVDPVIKGSRNTIMTKI